MLVALLLVAQAEPVRDLVRARERLELLIGAHARARAEALELDDAVTFDLNPEAAKKKRVEESKARVRETAQRALEGERAYDAARAALASLPADTLAGEASRAGSWLLKCELYEALGAARAHAALRGAMDVERDPDKTLAFYSEMPILYGSDAGSASSYVCPMHPEVTDTEASDCPKCGISSPAGTRYCRKCGASLMGEAVDGGHSWGLTVGGGDVGLEIGLPFSSPQREIVRERQVIMIRCKYCGTLNGPNEKNCTSCGAQM